MILAVTLFANAGRPQLRPTSAELVKIFEDLPQEFRGTEGYIRASEMYYDGKMSTAHSKIKGALTDSDFRQLGWPTRYEGTVDERREEAERLRTHALKFVDRSGYVRYADLFYQGDMTKALRNVRSVLSVEQYRSLNWPTIYSGSTLDFARDRQNLTGNVVQDYLGTDGYLLYAKLFYASDLSKTKANISSALSPRELSELSWGKVYRGKDFEFHLDQSRLLQQVVEPGVIDYSGREGYVRYANQFYDGNMDLAFVQMSAVLSDQEQAALNWGSKYMGSTLDFKLDRERLLSRGPSDQLSYLGPEGYYRFAVDFAGGLMSIAYSRMAVVLNDAEKKQLNWGKAYKGAATEYLSERQRLTQDYQGREGYLRYAREYYQGDLAAAFSNASAVLSEDERFKMRWGIKFKGHVMDLEKIRKFLSKSDGNLDFEKWSGKFTGLTKATDSYMLELGFELPFNENTRLKIRYQIRAAVDDSELKQLQWDYSQPEGELRSKKGRCVAALR